MISVRSALVALASFVAICMALAAPSLFEVYRARASEAAEARYRVNAPAEHGREWAEIRGVADANDCPTWNPTFTAACRARAEERLQARRAADARQQAEMAAHVAAMGPASRFASGHSAGYEWAEANYIRDEGDCENPSSSFGNGCREYVQERDARAEEESAPY